MFVVQYKACFFTFTAYFRQNPKMSAGLRPRRSSRRTANSSSVADSDPDIDGLDLGRYRQSIIYVLANKNYSSNLSCNSFTILLVHFCSLCFGTSAMGHVYLLLHANAMYMPIQPDTHLSKKNRAVSGSPKSESRKSRIATLKMCQESGLDWRTPQDGDSSAGDKPGQKLWSRKSKQEAGAFLGQFDPSKSGREARKRNTNYANIVS